MERAIKGVKAGGAAPGGRRERAAGPAPFDSAIPAEALRAAFDNLNQGFMLLDDSWRVADFNARVVEIVGYPAGAMRLGASAYELIKALTPVSRRSARRVEAIYEGWRQRVASRNAGSFFGQRADGRTINVGYAPVGANGWIFSYQDVSMQVEAQEAARRRNLQLDAALNNMSPGLCMFDADNKLIVCNENYARIFNLPAELTQQGTPLAAINAHRAASGMFPGDDGAAYFRDSMNIFITTSAPSRMVVTFGDGRTFAISPQRMSEGGWLATYEDITERTRAQNELERLYATLEAAKAEAERAAAQARAAHQQLIDASNVMAEGLVLLDAEDRHVLWNARYAEMFGEGREAIVPGGRFEDALRAAMATGQYPEANGREEEWLAARLERHRLPENSFEMQLPNGRWIRIDERRTADGGSIGVRVDITELKRREATLQQTREFLDAVIENMPAPVIVKDARTLRHILINRAAETFLGVSRTAFIGTSVEESYSARAAAIITERDRLALKDRRETFYDEARFETPSGEIRYATSKRIPIFDEHGAPLYILMVINDLTERRLAAERIAHLTSHDALTGLANRAAFGARLSEALERAGSAGVAALCVDIDRFKEINDVYGHSMADRVLEATARRLKEAAGEAFLARVGGDEFNLIVTDAEQPAEAAGVAAALLSAVAGAFEIDGAKIKIGLSIGVAIGPHDGADAATLLANAEAALDRAKHDGRGAARFFEPDMDKRLRERRALEHELKSAIECRQLRLHYQPQTDVSGRLLGFEALARWPHPVRGNVPPGVFIGIAEGCGAILDLGAWTLREACREAASWPGDLSIAVNLSPIQFRQSDLFTLIRDVLAETGLAGERLELEITEGVLIDDQAMALEVLQRIKGLGVRIAMDDFGTGYSSLAYLQSFPFDKIKIDRSFIANLDTSPNSAAIIRAVLGLSRGLNIPVIAEGVETDAQVAFLEQEGCDELQGYLMGRPRPIEEYSSWIHDGGAPSHSVRVVA